MSLFFFSSKTVILLFVSVLSPPHRLDSARWAGLRVGLLGGSFDPPHEGHVHISLSALKTLKLDYIWWLVSPQNPLKTRKPLSLDERMALSRALISHPRVLVSDLERQMGTSLTYDSVRMIKKHFPVTDFIWLSGMDNAHSLHHWNHWRGLLREISMGHLTRGPAKDLVRACPARLLATQDHVFVERPGPYDLSPGRTYWMMQQKMVHVSSRAIRAQGG